MKISSNIIKEIVEGMSSAPTWEFGDWVEISNDIVQGAYSEKTTSPYPMIIMHSNYSEQRSQSMGVDSEFTTTFYLVAESQQGYSTQDRIDNVFEPVLFPLHDEFLTALYKSPLLSFDMEQCPRGALSMERTTQNLYFLTNEGTDQNKINDVVDALSIELTIKVRRTEYKN